MSRSSGDFAVAVIESIDSLEEIDLPVLLFDSPSAMYNWEEDEAEDLCVSTLLCGFLCRLTWSQPQTRIRDVLFHRRRIEPSLCPPFIVV